MGAGFGLVGLANAAVRGPHFPGKAKRVIFLFLNGGMSQVDTFDPKPMLIKHDGEPMPGPKIKTDRASGNLMRSPFEFKKCGQSGVEVSEIFPQVGARIDDVCVIRSMYSDNGNHGPSLLMMNCGHGLPGRPSLGSWLTYGLGTENQNLPGFIVLCPGYPVLGAQLWDSAFLPSMYQGTYIASGEKEPARLLQNIRNSRLSLAEQERQLALVSKLNRSYLDRLGSQPQLEAGIAAMEVAFRMQTEAPDVFDIRKESEATLKLYGPGSTARGCLLAVRLAERGVRMVQIYYGKGDPWDAHSDIQAHRKNAMDSDQPFAAVIKDLKSRGLLKDTLVVCGSEFGRTPVQEIGSGAGGSNSGRDHNPFGFTMWLSGGGIKGGTIYGATDDFGFKVADKPVHVHDLHATILHLMGIDHTKLTYRYSGRDFRLTDVSGIVIQDILA